MMCHRCLQLRYQKCLDAHSRSAVQFKRQTVETERESKVRSLCCLRTACVYDRDIYDIVTRQPNHVVLYVFLANK